MLGLSVLAVAVDIHRSEVGWRTIDLDVYRAGANAILDGKDIYTVPVGAIPLWFTYPPFAAVLLTPVTMFDWHESQAVMTFVSVAALVASCAVLLRHVMPYWTGRTRLTLALLVAAVGVQLEPVSGTIGFGQINVVLMLLVLVDMLGPRGRLPQGVLVGLATAIKITPGIFVLYFVVTRRWRAAGAATAAFAAASGLGFAITPEPSWRYWTQLLFDSSRVGPIEYSGNQSLRGVAARLSGSVDGGAALWVLAAVGVLVFGMRHAAAASRNGDEMLGVVLCAVTGLLISPITWNHHWVWAVPVAILLWARCLRTRTPSRVAAAIAWTLLFYLGPIWWPPIREQREFDHHGLQLLEANAYVLAALILLASAPLLLRDRAAGDGSGGVRVWPRPRPVRERVPTPG